MPGETPPEPPSDLAVKWHHIEATVGNVMDTRRRGFLKGSAPFVSFIDPDDQVIGEPFSECVRIAQVMPYSVVYTNSILEDDSKLYPVGTDWSLDLHRTHRAPIHQVAVMRRELVEKALDKIFRQPELVAATRYSMEMHLIYAYLVKEAPAFLLDTYIGYRYNDNTGRRTRKKISSESKLFVRDYIDNLLFGESDETRRNRPLGNIRFWSNVRI